MLIGYEIVNVHNDAHGITRPFYKLLFPANERSILHRWKSPHSTVHLRNCNLCHYFVQNKSSPSFIQSLYSTENSKQILRFILSSGIFLAFELQNNYAFNIFDTSLDTIFEARIITCFYRIKNGNSVHQDIYWDLFIDHLSLHLYVSSSVLRQLMSSTYTGTILAFCLNHKTKNSLSKVHNDLYLPRKTTVILTINKETLHEQFDYNNNVMELQKPTLSSNNLSFHPSPLHVGNGILLSNQNDDFNKEENNKIIKLHKKKKNRLHQCKMIVICNKKELEDVVNHKSSKLFLNFVSVSKKDEQNSKICNHNLLDLNFHNQSSDDYAILLIAANPKRSSDMSKYPNFNKEIAASIKEIRNPNMKSTDGKKHNRSFGEYYGFGIINKYKIDVGLSFGLFESKKKENEIINKSVSNMMREQFLFLIDRLNKILKHSFESGNQQIDSIVNYGRLSTYNQKFIDTTDSSHFLCDNCFSMWLCHNARTEQFHQEVDVSYTLIGIPIKIDKCNERKDHNCSYKFQFRWNLIENINCKGIDIGLFDGMVLYYNGIGLFHRQVPCSMNYLHNSFWNLSIYHNYRLFNSISKSLSR